MIHSRGPARDHDTRRLRDLLRAAVLSGGHPNGQLPSEAELMVSHQATRAAVRTALAMLRDEGLIERTQGVGTHAVVAPTRASMEEALGVPGPGGGMLFGAHARPRVLDRSAVTVPGSLAGWLGAPAGTGCLRLEYVLLVDEQPVSVATNYVLEPQATRLRAAPFHSDWYRLLADAGVVIGESEFVLDSVPADPLTARLLGVGGGSPLLALDQTIRDPRGRVFNVAFIRMRPNRFRFVSRARTPTIEEDRT